MKLTKIVFIMSILLLVVLASCQGRVAVPRQQVDFFQGSKGLTVEFLDEAPPSEVFETSEFDVQLNIHNQGAFDLVDPFLGIVDIIYDTDKVELRGGTLFTRTEPIPVSLVGRSLGFPNGETNFFPLAEFRAKSIFGNFQQNTGTFIAQVCYPYQTSFADDVCIDTSGAREEIREQVCTQEDRTYGRGQGAPLEVVAVDSQMIPKGVYVQPQFTIHIKHTGDGTIAYRDIRDPSYNVAQCQRIDTEDVNKISARVTLGVNELTCLPAEIVLRGGEAKIQCQLTEDSILGVSANYQTNLIAELGYIYTESFRKDITIQKSLATITGEEQDPSKCFAWEEYDTATQTCVTACRFQADRNNHDDPLGSSIQSLSQTLALELGGSSSDYLWSQVDCIYKGSKECQDDSQLCLLENNLCPPGNFCGLDSCVLKNKPPRITDYVRVGLDTLSFSCEDPNDETNLRGTCGCIPWAEFAFVNEKVNCDNYTAYTRITDFTRIVNKYTYEVDFDLTNKEDKFLCLRVQDTFGEAKTRRLKYPFVS